MARWGRRGRVGRWFERVALGAVIGTAVVVVERRLLKRLRGPGGARTGGPDRESDLAVSPQQVDEEA